ncbi:acyl-CoA thioesterase [Curtobacterium sp. C2H10]|uniref:acyl-CoA thioesterase n=1 Tax=Curtobacterium sp. C2H10 TaxID=2736664 RepID=UPI0021BE2CA4|nr:acyl-CoA thioesterase [Curtobacterium sp. C2H10]MCT9620243.1 thioesterase family protein [Curtobacterium sp. C2H10]
MNLYFRLFLLQLRVRLRPAIGGRRPTLWDEVRTPFRVTLTDLDPLRHVNNGKYLSMLDLGRLDLMLRSGFWGAIAERGWYPVVSAQTITYKRSLTLGQRFELVTHVLGMDDRAAYLEQTFVRRGTVVARAVVQARFLLRTGGTVSPSELLEAAGATDRDLSVPEWVHEWAGATRISSSGTLAGTGSETPGREGTS